MKKQITLIAGAAALLALMPLTSCDKIKDELFKAFSANSGSVNFSVAILSDTTRQVKAGEMRTERYPCLPIPTRLRSPWQPARFPMCMPTKKYCLQYPEPTSRAT